MVSIKQSVMRMLHIMRQGREEGEMMEFKAMFERYEEAGPFAAKKGHFRAARIGDGELVQKKLVIDAKTMEALGGDLVLGDNVVFKANIEFKDIEILTEITRGY